MTRGEKGKRQAIIDACRRMNALGIDRSTAGNIRARQEGGVLTGQLPLLPGDETERVRRKMAGYGHSDG